MYHKIFNKHQDPVIIKSIFLLLSLAAIFYNLFNLSIPLVYDLYPKFSNYDYYYLFEAANNFLIEGVPQIKYWPNSSAGLDLFAWDKFSNILIFTFFLNISGQGIESILFLDSVYKILSFIIIYLSFYQFSIKTKYIIITLGFLCYDPVAYFFLVNKQYYGLAYGVLFFCFISISFAFSGLFKFSLYKIFFVGILSAIFILWFVPLGIYFFFTIILIILKSYFEKNHVNNNFLRLLTFYLIGIFFGVLILFFAAIYIGNYESLKKNLFSGLSIYLDSPNYMGLQQRVVFILDTFLPSQGFSLVVPTILYLTYFRYLQNFRNFEFKINKSTRFIIDTILINFIAYIVIGLIFPKNIYLARLSWSLPLIFYLVVKIFFSQEFKSQKKIFLTFLLYYFIIYLNFFLCELFYGIKIAWALTFLMSMLLSVFFVKKYFNIINFFNNLKAYLLIIFCVFIFTFLRWEQFINYKNRYYSNEIISIKKYIYNKNFKDYIVSNAPLGILNKNINVHLVQSYKGLINGLMPYPASTFIYFISFNQTSTCKINFFKYGLHTYKIKNIEKLENNLFVCIGEPISDNEVSSQIVNLDNLDDNFILEYQKNMDIK